MKTHYKQYVTFTAMSLRLSCFLIFITTSAFASAQNDIKQDNENIESAESDLLRLESRFIGDKEQPLVSYIVPWQGTDSPDDLKWKIERKNDDTLSLVDRDIMLRSMNIYSEMGLE